MNSEPPDLPIRNRQGIPGRVVVVWLVVAGLLILALLALVTFFAVREIEASADGRAVIGASHPLEVAGG